MAAVAFVVIDRAYKIVAHTVILGLTRLLPVIVRSTAAFAVHQRGNIR